MAVWQACSCTCRHSPAEQASPATRQHPMHGLPCHPSPRDADVMIKPDGVQRGLVGEIISRFERKGFKLIALKLFQCTKYALEASSCTYACTCGCGGMRGL